MIDLEKIYIQSSRDHKEALQAVFDAGFAEGMKRKLQPEFENDENAQRVAVSQTLGMGNVFKQ
jgi:hypothetical protein